MVEEIKDPMLKSFLSELVSIVDKARERGLQIRLVGPAAIYLHILNCRECVELYERLLARGAAPPKAPAPAKPEVKEVPAEAKLEARPPAAPPAVKAPEVAEDPRALEDEVLLSMLMLKSELIATVRVEASCRDLLKYVSEALPQHVRNFQRENVYVSVRTPEKHVRLLYSKGKLIGVRVDLADGTVVNGREAVANLLGSEEVIKARAYVFRVPEDVIKKFAT
ncbi:MAG: hypothetical protein J7L12_03455 [Desulfurococcales archaeon]|nr:hypothetical protein [Desulfurococcales archaeon]